MPICRICGSTENQSVRAPHVFGGESLHNFWQCKKCDAIYLYPVPSIEAEKHFYLSEFESFMSKRTGDHRDWTSAEKHKKTNQDQVERRIPFLQEYLKPGKNLLEIGCSSGFMLDAFREYGLNCTGVEPSGVFSEFLIETGYTIASDISEVSGKKFDVVAHFFVFEHIRDPFSFLQLTYDMLNDNGVIICEIPCANDALTTLYNIDAFEKFYWSIAHHYYYTPKAVSFILDRLGYRYKLVPEQRYDLSNHMTWLMDGKPGGQGRFSEEFGEELVEAYRRRLVETWRCDSMFLYIWK